MPTLPHDPYLWLEDSENPNTLAWVDEQNTRTRLALEQDPRYRALADQILANMQNSAQIPLFSMHDGVLYNFHQDALHPRGVYRSTTLASYCEAEAQWQIVLDIDALAAAEQVDWYLAGVDHCTMHSVRCLISLNIGGSDRCVIREYDLSQQAFVVGGFEFPYSKSQISWRDLDSVFVCPAWDDDQLTQAGYSREVVLYRRGQDWEDAASMMVLPTQIFKVAAWRFLDGDGTPLDLIDVAPDFYRSSFFILNAEQGDEAEPIHLPLPARSVIEAYSHGDLIVRLDMDWTYPFAGHEQQFSAGSLIAIACEVQTGQLGRAQLLFAPSAKQSVQMLEATLSGLYLVVLDNVTSRVLSWLAESGRWRMIDNALPTGSVVEIVTQPWRSDELYFLFNDFLRPAALYRTELGAQSAPQLLRQQPAAFDASQLQTIQCHAQSKDGTTIPYFLVSHASIKLDGNTPTLIYGYGGFKVPMLPYYLDNLGEHWLNQGCAYVVANIRGGGEFGPAWHEAARGAKRQCSFDDFIAIAEDLIARGVTQPAKMAIQGGSNGGLLVASCMVQRPELFAAVVSEVPLLDMLRFDELGAGASWVAEYGNPKVPKDAQYLGVYSPYQNVKSATEQPYPRVLISTSSQDDRVHPAHARKMAAKLQNMGHDAFLHESGIGGHAGQTGQSQTANDLARVLVFLRQSLQIS